MDADTDDVGGTRPGKPLDFGVVVGGIVEHAPGQPNAGELRPSSKIVSY
jgi:hypothetical protein